MLKDKIVKIIDCVDDRQRAADIIILDVAIELFDCMQEMEEFDGEEMSKLINKFKARNLS